MLLKSAVFELQLHTDCSRQPGGKPVRGTREEGRGTELDRVGEREREREDRREMKSERAKINSRDSI